MSRLMIEFPVHTVTYKGRSCLGRIETAPAQEPKKLQEAAILLVCALVVGVMFHFKTEIRQMVHGSKQQIERKV